MPNKQAETAEREQAEMTDQEFAQACYDSPAFFAREILDIEPTPQQEELFRALEPPGAHVAVRSGHGVGKSTSLAVVALWFLTTREDAKVPCTAPSAHQLDDVLWSEIRRLHARMSEYMQGRIQIKADKVTMQGSAGYIVARTARPENPDALQGFHADNILFIIDEAAGVAEKVFEVARGALSTPSARVVMTGNPTQLSGYFHNAFHLARDSWTRLCFSCLESPLVDPGYAEDIGCALVAIRDDMEAAMREGDAAFVITPSWEYENVAFELETMSRYSRSPRTKHIDWERGHLVVKDRLQLPRGERVWI